MLRKPISAELRVRVRRDLSGDGEVTEAKTVSCERREHSVSLSECRTCKHCDGTSLDGTKLLCNWPRPHARAESALASLARRLFPQIAHETRVGEVMATHVVCVQPDVSVEALTELLLQHGFSGAPVVDAEGFPIGVVSQTDLLREAHDRGDTV